MTDFTSAIDAVLGEKQRKTPTVDPAQSTVGKFDSAISQYESNQAALVNYTADKTPSDYAESIRVSKKTDIPAEVVGNDLNYFKSITDIREKQRYLAKNPALWPFVEKNPEKYGLIQNDMSIIDSVVNGARLGIKLDVKNKKQVFTKRPSASDFPVNAERDFVDSVKELKAAQFQWDDIMTRGEARPMDRTIARGDYKQFAKDLLEGRQYDVFLRGYQEGKQALGMGLDRLDVFSGVNRDISAAWEAEGLTYSPNAVRAARIQQQQREIEKFPIPLAAEDGLREIQEADGPFESLAAIVRNPVATAYAIQKSIGAVTPGLAVTVGLSVLGPLGTATGAGLTSFAIEFGSTLQEVMQENKVNMNDVGSIRRGLENKELMDKARNKGLQRGIPIALFDAATAGFAGKILAAFSGRGRLATAGAVGAEAGVQMTGGAVGEATAQMVSGEEKLKWGDIWLEAIGELPTAVPEAWSNYSGMRARYEQKRAEQSEGIITAAVNADTMRNAMNQVKNMEAAKLGDEGKEAIAQVFNQANPDASVTINVNELMDLSTNEEFNTLQSLNQDYAGQILQAIDQQTDVEIKMGDFLAVFSQSARSEEIIAAARMNDSDMTLNEAKVMSQEQDVELQREMEALIADQEKRQSFYESREAVKQSIFDQLNQANRFTSSVNEVNATIAAARFATRAAQLGITPQEFYEQRGLNIVAQSIVDEQAFMQDTTTPEFKQWFGDSKVVDVDGAPLRLFRGMAGAVIPEEGVVEMRPTPGLLGTGIYMTGYPRRAAGYAEGERGQVYPLYASIKNPISEDDFIERFGREQRTDEENQAITDQLISEGYDGIIADRGPGKAWEAVAFRPEQVKSVFNERPTQAPEIFKQAVKGEPGANNPGAGVEDRNRLGFWPALRVKITGKATIPDKPLIMTGTTNANAQKQIDQIDAIMREFPNATATPEQWSKMMAYALGSDEVPVPPYAFIRDLNGTGSIDKLRTLTQGQIDDATAGFDNAREFRRAYTAGELSVETTGKLFMWSFLSRGVSPYTQEALFIDSFNGANEWIAKAARGEFTQADFPEYEAWAKSVAPKGSGQPGAGATHNLNAFGQDFLFKMSKIGKDGKSHLQRLHDMMSDPNQTGKQIRREFATFGEGVGIDNKVVSFTLLVAGFNDVMVLDRVQIRQLWDDGKFAGVNLYDGVTENKEVTGKDGVTKMKPVKIAGSSLNNLAEGVRGILVYEAIERGLESKIGQIYTDLGRPQDASIGRYHWETWVADSQQEAAHGSLGAILADAKGDDQAIAKVHAKQGEYGAYEYGALYNRDVTSTPWFGYETPTGNNYSFSVPAFRAFLEDIKRPATGVVPKKFKVTESGNAPWYTRPEVNQQRLDERAAYWADLAGGTGEGRSAVEQAVQAAQPDGARPQPGDGEFFQSGGAGVQRLRTSDLNVAARYGTTRDGATTVVGVHYSSLPRNTLSGQFYGTGLKGAEAGRLGQATDNRLSNRIHFYVDTGSGIAPEAGVGGNVHAVNLQNLYNIEEDALGLRAEASAGGRDPQNTWFNGVESAVLDAGFDGIYIPSAQGTQGVAVLLGPQNVGVPVDQLGTHSVPAAGMYQPPSTGKRRISLLPDEIQAFNDQEAQIKESAPSAFIRNGNLVFDEADTQAITDFFPAAANAKVLMQNARGTFNPRTNTITLMRDANLSTFAHELAHFFFEDDILLASELMGKENLTIGEQQIINDVSKLMSWHGIQGNAIEQIQQYLNMDFEEKRAYHERTAESFERYMFSGKAPSIELQPYFQRFRSWMISVYNSIKEFLISNPEAGKLNAEVREVFDRMLATNDQIELAQQNRSMMPLFESAQEAGMTTEEFARYQDENSAASAEAMDDLTAKTLQDMKWMENAKGRELRRLQKEASALRAEMKIEARRQILSQPVYQAWQFLTGKPQQPTVDLTEYQLEVAEWERKKAEALDEARIEIRTKLWADSEESKKTYDTTKSAGLAKGQFLSKHRKDVELDVSKFALEYDRKNPKPTKPDVPTTIEEMGEVVYGKLNTAGLAALEIPEEITGFLKTLRMVATDGIDPDMLATQFGFSSGDEMVRTLAAAEKPQIAIDRLTDQLMLEQYGEYATPEALAMAADMAIHNEARARFIATEMAAIAKAAGKPRVLANAAKNYARQIIDRMKIIDVRPVKYASAEARAAKAAEKAMIAGKTQEVYAEKRNQMLNNQTAKAAYEAVDEIQKGVRYLKKFDSEGVRKSIDIDYQDQIDTLLERFNLSSGQSRRSIEKRKQLKDWLDSQEEMGIEVDVPVKLKNEALRQSYKELTVEEFRGLVDMIKQVEHLGRLKQRLLTQAEDRRFADIITEMVTSVEANAGNKKAVNRTRDTLPSRITALFNGYTASHRKVASLARELDGFKDGGSVWNYLIRTMNDAGNREATMRAEATQKMAKLIKPIMKLGKMGGNGKFFPTLGQSFNRGERIIMVANMGNAGNMQRLLDGNGWTREQVQPIIDSLSEQELKFVQEIWDFFESYRPMIAEKERRVMGKEPDWVEPVPLNTKAGTLRGGYFPIVYDPKMSGRAEQQSDAEAAKQQLRGAFVAATTRRSFVKSRAEAVMDRPLLLTWDGLFRGVNEVIHDLTWHEWVIDANRIIKNAELDDAVRSRYGSDVIQQFKASIRDIAAGESASLQPIEKGLNYLRAGSAIAGLGFNIMNAFLQPLGLTQSIVRIGPKWVAMGIGKWATSPVGMVKDVWSKSEFMANRHKTQQREMNEIQSVVTGKGPIRQKIDTLMFVPMISLQLIADMPTWWGAYQKALTDVNVDMTEEAIEKRAIALADQAVLDSQSGGQIKDLAQVQRGGAALKLFTVFYGYFSASYNLGVERTKAANFRKPLDIMHLGWDYLMLFSVPAVLGMLLKEALQPGEADDEEELANKLIGEQISYMMNMMVGLREAVGAAQYMTGTKQFDSAYGGPAGLRFFQELDKLGKQIGQGEIDRAFTRSAVNVLGIAAHLPSAQMNRTIDGVIAISEDQTENPMALLMGIKK
jgi:hypothetical protein